ncbi:tryptophan-rich sensory protein [Actinotalea ferrariae]|uniref:tryptophan-rich sensory protein n=1 Tax=Actinotalea ferrariae TaxID=1386098 RepID=UPI001C8B8552|nr:tryptophan-rich sensory protein [Actinotalea ferrariae]MBX9246174.1 tryptophan-rich sensory protein [Actinotalea ferrariae]
MQRSDVVRQAGVLVLALVATAGAFLGSGALGGTPIAEAADGALSASATPVAPGSPAFSIWSVIYTGLLAYAVWQALPAQREDARQRRMGWLAAASMLLNAAWIGVVQLGVLWLSVAVIVALLVVLVLVLRICIAVPRRSLLEALVVDGTFGLYLGWVTIATIANTAAALAASDVGPLGLGPTLWSVVLLITAALIGLAFALQTGGRLAFALALAWGLAWVAIARTTDEPRDIPVAAAAACASVVTLGSAVVVRVRDLVAARREGRTAPTAAAVPD